MRVVDLQGRIGRPSSCSGCWRRPIPGWRNGDTDVGRISASGRRLGDPFGLDGKQDRDHDGSNEKSDQTEGRNPAEHRKQDQYIANPRGTADHQQALEVGSDSGQLHDAGRQDIRLLCEKDTRYRAVGPMPFGARSRCSQPGYAHASRVGKCFGAGATIAPSVRGRGVQVVDRAVTPVFTSSSSFTR